MKRINQYRKLFGVEKNASLKELKSIYRNLVKTWHPDKFQKDDPQFEIASQKSTEIIDAYHFLVSISPETKEKELEDYQRLINDSGIKDFHHKGQLLTLTFLDGTTYEYFGVDQKLFQKMVNSDKIYRFAKRNIFTEFLYRKVSNQAEQPED